MISNPGTEQRATLGHRLLVALPHLVLLVVGAIVLAVSLDYGWLGPAGVEPGLFPGVAAVVLMCVTAYEAVHSLLLKRRRESGEERPGIDRVSWGGADVKSVALLVLAAAIVAVSSVIGLLPAIWAGLMTILVAFERISVIRALLVSTAAVAAMWGIFDYGLNVPLPQLEMFGG